MTQSRNAAHIRNDAKEHIATGTEHIVEITLSCSIKCICFHNRTNPILVS